ncbi:hypothetical protein SAMN05421505_1613 [Sinosporangium album]|uniref:Uncharacterized protein n=1 Tax=Sinosporangium album TaxID=504805 RepID=A0A1G8L3Y1_9ACTN|nr:hypothetical protein [Sinosporangium album]SDI50378.1 hypothetical protein SAMN05421505_1613 [Sinosporangium album]
MNTVVRVRWTADRPPTPTGCRWCGHPAAAHPNAELPHRPQHAYAPPTTAQAHARSLVWRHLADQAARRAGMLPIEAQAAAAVAVRRAVPRQRTSPLTRRPRGRTLAGKPLVEKATLPDDTTLQRVLAGLKRLDR